MTRAIRLVRRAIEVLDALIIITGIA